MANRNTLHKTRLEDFAAFLETIGYTAVDSKGDYEVLRMTCPNCLPIIIYQRLGAEHLSVQEKDQNLLHLYMKQRGVAQEAQMGLELNVTTECARE